jgi:hypothetical protein
MSRLKAPKKAAKKKAAARRSRAGRKSSSVGILNENGKAARAAFLLVFFVVALQTARDFSMDHRIRAALFGRVFT